MIKLKLDIKGHELELTLEEARGLMTELKALFPDPPLNAPLPIPYHTPMNPANPKAPIPRYVYPDIGAPRYEELTVTCKNKTNGSFNNEPLMKAVLEG